jgi:hypothetical protein
MMKKFLMKAVVCLFAVVAFGSCNKDEVEAPKSAECNIISFAVNGEDWRIDGTNIAHEYPVGTAQGLLTPVIKLSPGAKINPSADEQKNFFNGVSYTVTAEDGKATKTYKVKATIVSNDNLIISFTVNGVPWNISGDSITYPFHPETTQETSRPVITLSDGATVSPASGEPQNLFAKEGVTYTVTAENGSKKTYIAKALIQPAITLFRTGDTTWTIDVNSDSITYTYPAGTTPHSLTPTIITSLGATVSPASGEEQPNLFAAEGVPYTVTAEGCTPKTYIVKAKITPSVLSIDPASLEFTYEAGEKTIAVTTNVPSGYTVVIKDEDKEWLSYETVETGILIKATLNTGPERSADITLTATGVEPVTLHVTQQFVSLSVDPKELFFKFDETTEQTVVVISQSDYTVDPTESWVTAEKSEEGLKVKMSSNNTGATRTATVTVRATGVDEPVTLTVTQYKEPRLDWSPRIGWTAEAKGEYKDGWGTGNDTYHGGNPNLIFDGIDSTGWHTESLEPLPHILVIDMKKQETVHSLRITHLKGALGYNENGEPNQWIYLGNVDIYLSDTPIDPNAENPIPSDWTHAKVYNYNYPGTVNPFEINFDTPATGQYLIMRFNTSHAADSHNDTYISFTELDVKVDIYD